MMKQGLFYLFIIITCSSCTSTHEPQNIEQLKKAIQESLSVVEGDFAVAFKNLDNPEEEILINAHESFHAASTMKTPVLLEVYKQAAEGKFDLDDSIIVKNEFKSIVDSSLYSLNPEDDSFDELYEQIGQQQSIRDITYLMIIASSNLATNIIIELVGAHNVTESMRHLGAQDIQVLRGVEDTKAYQKGFNNTTTAYDLMLLFETIGKKEAVSEQASQEMINILLDQKFHDIIPAKLPNEVKVAHKTGRITGVRHDSGIIFLPDGRRYVLVLLSKNLNDEEAGVETMATVSKMIYQHVAQKKVKLENAPLSATSHALKLM